MKSTGSWMLKLILGALLAGLGCPVWGQGAPTYLPLSGGALTGPLVLSGDPTQAQQAATKNYVDLSQSGSLPLTGGVVTGALTVANHLTKWPRVDARSLDLAGGADPTGVKDSLPAIQAAIAFAQASASRGDATYPTIYLAPGHYKVSGTIRLPSNLHLAGDSKANTILQETGAKTNLITVTGGKICSTYSCYGGIEGITLQGSGKATTGTLLEMDFGFFILRDLHFFNNGGRGLQLNGPAERLVGYDLSFNDIRWPMVLAGDTNEDYFFNTHVIEAGETRDASGSASGMPLWCYSVNCTQGVFNAPGTSGSPTVLYPDPHGSIHIDKAVNVAFVGGSIKSTAMLSGVRVWNANMVKFENMYHEDVYGGNIPRLNRAYILGGKAEQTYFTSALGTGTANASVHDTSWMPQYFGDPADVVIAGTDFYPYVILPQDYNRSSTAPSAYVPGLLQNQFEVVNIEGFAGDGNLYLTGAGRHIPGSTAPASVVWPAGSVIEQFSGVNGFSGAVELTNVHLNQVQGPLAVGGYQVGCNQQTANNCGEIVAGFAPDPQSPSADPSLNQTGFFPTPGDPLDPIPGAIVGLNLRMMDMSNDPINPYVGQVSTHRRVFMQVYGKVNPEALESGLAVTGNAAGKQVSIAAATGGGVVTAPFYAATQQLAAVQVSLPEADTLWDSTRGFFSKKASVFGKYQQYGSYMNGIQFQNQYCLFDTPAVDGGHVTNRFCTGGGPTNLSGNAVGIGGGIEYDSWNGTSWINLFKVYGQNGTGVLSSSANASFGAAVAVSGALTSGTLSTGALNSASVVTSGSVTSGLVATQAITSKTAAVSGAVTSGSLTTGAVNSTSETVAGAVAASSVSATGAVTSGSVATGAVNSASETVSGAVTSGSLTTGAVLATSENVTGPVTSTSVSTGAIAGSSLAVSGPVSGSSLNLGGGTMSSVPVMVWNPFGPCTTQGGGCLQSAGPVNLISPVTIENWSLIAVYTPMGCANPGAVTLYNGTTALATINLANGVTYYTATMPATALGAGTALQIRVSTLATGCAQYGAGFSSNVVYAMQ